MGIGDQEKLMKGMKVFKNVTKLLCNLRSSLHAKHHVCILRNENQDQLQFSQIELIISSRCRNYNQSYFVAPESSFLSSGFQPF
jgi:hypothetical protein